MELRFPDSAANPYLALALIISAGLKGIEDGLDEEVAKRISIAAVAGIPKDLKTAASCAREDAFITDVVGDSFSDIYLDAREAEWDSYMREVSDWEMRNYLYKF